MIAGPVAVIPLACGRLELGLWPCGRLDTMVARPVTVIPLDVYSCSDPFDLLRLLLLLR